MKNTKDYQVLRELASRYMEAVCTEEQAACRDLWRRHNSLKKTRAPIYVRAIPFAEVPELQHLVCEDPFLRGCEEWFRIMLFRTTIGDDYTFDPWFAVRAVFYAQPFKVWGVEVKKIESGFAGGSAKFDPPIKSLADKDLLVFPRHAMDEDATARNWERMQEAVGDIMPVIVDRGPLYTGFNGDISTYLGHMRGIEQVMWDMMDNPEWLHELLAFMRDGILSVQDEAEKAGDWHLCDHLNQAMPYAEELPDPSPSTEPVTRDRLWGFMAAQEMVLVSPEMHEEFMLRYQLPILKKFGLVAYGCCEDLTEKIDMLRQIPNLRRIAVAPTANVRRCAEQIGRDYVFSYRPNPAEMGCCGFDPEHVRAFLRKALADCRECCVDITLKDVQTVEGKPERLREWARIARETAEEMA